MIKIALENQMRFIALALQERQQLCVLGQKRRLMLLQLRLGTQQFSIQRRTRQPIGQHANRLDQRQHGFHALRLGRRRQGR